MHSKQQEIQENLTLTAPTIYEIISKEAEQELGRPVQSLVFSGIAAGLCISFSLFVMGYLSLMSDNPLIVAMGYCVGFLVVIKGRMQLFTENTITVILPLLKNTCWRNFKCTGRLWGIVFVTNMIGTFLAAFMASQVGIATPDQLAEFIKLSSKAMDKTSAEIFLTAIPAGFILAAMVWMLPSAQSNKFFIILMMTYVISIGGFAHVVAGSTKAFLLLLEHQINLSDCLQYIALAGAGNIVGGSVLFSVLAYAQTSKELK